MAIDMHKLRTMIFSGCLLALGLSLNTTARASEENRARELKMSNQATETPIKAAHRTYLEHPESGSFIELSETDNQMKIRRGKVGLPCLVYNLSWKTPNLGEKQFDRLQKQFQNQGYQSGKPSQPIVEGSVAGQLFTDDILEHPRYKAFFDLGWASELRTQNKRLIHFPNGLRYDDDFDLEEIADMDLDAGLIIEGDVRIKGVFSQLTYTYPGSTLILGNVYAKSLRHADGFMSIRGDVTVDNIIYGRYNDGSLQISGTATGRLWYSSDHDMSAAKFRIKQLDWGETEGLVDELRTASDAEDDSFEELIRDYIFNNKNPLQTESNPVNDSN